MCYMQCKKLVLQYKCHYWITVCEFHDCIKSALSVYAFCHCSCSKMHKLKLAECLCLFLLSEGERSFCEKSSSAKCRQWYLGSWVPETLLGVFAEQPAHPGRHTARRDNTGSLEHCLQGGPLKTALIILHYQRLHIREMHFTQCTAYNHQCNTDVL